MERRGAENLREKGDGGGGGLLAVGKWMGGIRLVILCKTRID